MKRASIVLSVALVCGAASADESFVAYADVVDVEPLFETHRVPVRREVCRWEAESAFELEGRARSGPLQGRSLEDLAFAIGQQAAHARSRERVCAQVLQTASERRVRAYRVKYRYRGKLYEAETETRPRDRLRVRVNVSAVGDSRRSPTWR